MEKLYVHDLKKDWKEKQKFNIDAFNNLDRDGLNFERKIQRKLLLKEFDSGEKLYITYPGKESNTNANRKRVNPNDFYPELILKDGSKIETKAFANVWDDLFSFNKEKIDMSALATLLIRLAYMYDSKKVKNSYTYQDINDSSIINSNTLEFEYYEYSPTEELFKEIGISTSLTIKGSRIIPYLTYHDLIAQNEDCKYINIDKKKKHIASNIGRRNTFLTHVSVIAYIEGEIKFSELLQQFQRGVAPIKLEKFYKITTNRICKNKIATSNNA